MDNEKIKEKIKTLNDETISNMLNQRKNHTSLLKDFLIDEQKKRKKPKATSLSFLNFNKYEKFKIDLLEQIKKDPVLNYHYDTFNNLSLEQLFTLRQFLKILNFDELSRLKGSMSIILKKPEKNPKQLELNLS